jgi:uncharacterized membrane protein YgdD (TMEM256/DUF423 family)
MTHRPNENVHSPQPVNGPMGNPFFFIACLSGFFAVALGAFGAHSLKSTLSPEMLTVFETGVRYQMYHAFALLAVGWALDRFGVSLFQVAGWLFVAGSVLFSGSLYALAVSGTRWLGAITPLGGLAFLAGWCVFGYGFLKR